MRNLIPVVVLGLFLVSCGSAPAPIKKAKIHDHDHDHDHEHHNDHDHEKEKKHEHTAPNGGTLIEIGGEFAHIEMLVSAEKDQLTCYIFDADLKFAEKAEQSMIECSLVCAEMPEPLSVEFLPVVNELSGNTKTSSSEFVAKIDLKNKTNIKLQLKSVKIKGKEFNDIEIVLK